MVEDMLYRGCAIARELCDERHTAGGIVLGILSADVQQEDENLECQGMDRVVRRKFRSSPLWPEGVTDPRITHPPLLQVDTEGRKIVRSGLTISWHNMDRSWRCHIHDQHDRWRG
jgi:hypothetical protein